MAVGRWQLLRLARLVSEGFGVSLCGAKGNGIGNFKFQI